jgi:hypothetical protein
MTTRRRFIEIMPLAGAALLAACSDKKAVVPEPAATLPPPAPAAMPPGPAPAAEPAAAPTVLLDEKSEKAVGLGYVSDATRADATKYKTYAAGQVCSNCALFQGKAGDASGPCPLFAGSAVAAKGWCSAYNKKMT